RAIEGEIVWRRRNVWAVIDHRGVQVVAAGGLDADEDVPEEQPAEPEPLAVEVRGLLWRAPLPDDILPGLARQFFQIELVTVGRDGKNTDRIRSRGELRVVLRHGDQVFYQLLAVGRQIRPSVVARPAKRYKHRVQAGWRV